MRDLEQLDRISALELVSKIIEEESDRGALTNRLASLLEQACRNGAPHQSYRNYETFSVAVVLDNDEPWYREIRNMAEQAPSPSEIGPRVRALLEGPAEDLPAELRESAESVRGQLLAAALETVDWRELGETWAEQAREAAAGR
jgi:hypothetical protein